MIRYTKTGKIVQRYPSAETSAKEAVSYLMNEQHREVMETQSLASQLIKGNL